MSVINRIINKAKRLVFNKDSAATIANSPEWSIPNPKDSDIYLVSYPKSGNTWMRYLMAYAIWPELAEVDLVEMAAYMPSFALQHDSLVMLDPNSPCNQQKHRIIKEHTPYDGLAKLNVRNAIYIARDGRDAMVSYWHFCNQRDGTAIPFSSFIELSVVQPRYSFGRWKDHLESWMNAPLNSKLILRYEDMLADTAGCLRRALEFAEIDATEAVIKKAVERASFNSMKKLEKTKGLNLEQLQNVEFVRKGKSGSWSDTFGPGDLERFNQFHGGGVPELGYTW